MHLYSNSLSTIATFSSSIISEIFPACFSRNNKFNLSQISVGSDYKFIVFEKVFFFQDDVTPEAETIMLGD